MGSKRSSRGPGDPETWSDAAATDPLRPNPNAVQAPDDRPATYREVFAVREFRYLFNAYLLSLIGDQLAKVALSVVVFERTGSAFLSAVTFAVSYLPWLVGGPVLAVYADRLPRRQIMIGCDLLRALLVACLVVPGVPLWVMVVLLFVASLLAPPFEAARAATTPEVLAGDRYAVGLSLSSITSQLAQVAGFVLGGALVAVLSPGGALLIDVATFLLSALLLRIGVLARPAAERAERVSLWADARTGIAVVFGTPRVRRLILMLWCASALGFAPEGLAAAYAAELDEPTQAVGLLLAASPLGLIVGGVVIGRMVRPSRRETLLVPLAALSVLALVPAAGLPWVGAVLVLFFLSGIGFSFVIPLNVMVVRSVDPAARARAFAVVASGLQGAQGIGIVLAGLAAEVLDPSIVVSLVGVVGTVLVLTIGLRHRAAPTRPAHPVTSSV
ncbi:MAG: MFS transporter [Geodermatophilaceae bacterium]|nr:MFS transporter [Geodermatophilaceae bacterium]